jgi:hypothetical protein
MACGADSQPETSPRCCTGTWSEIVAVSAALTTQNPTRARHQAAPMPTSVPCWPSSSRPAANSSAPARIHGRRRPKREVVRSEAAPASG